MIKLENHHIATPKATIDIGNLNPRKDFTIMCNAYGEIHDGWISTLLNLSITRRGTIHTLCASLIINATGLGNRITAPSGKYSCPPPQKKKIQR